MTNVLDKAGLQKEGYIDKKGVTASQATNPDTRYNEIPPGDMIGKQKLADIHEMPKKQVTGMGYPGDGWTGPSESI